MSARTRTIAARLVLALATAALVLPGPPAAAARQHTIGAFFIDYLPDSISINNGDSIVFFNTDPFAGEGHTMTHATNGTQPLFDSEVVPFGQSAEVPGIPALKRGEYLFRCRIHPLMTGFLFVGGDARSPTDRISDLIR